MSFPAGFYHPLSTTGREIRLLTLQAPKSPDESPEIECTLSTALLDNHPSFHALSYVWGSPSITELVKVNDKVISATENLCAALRHIQKCYGNIVLWVDALCINQSDDVEKSQQVQLMRDIYTSATQVIAWLGDANDDSHLAISTFEKFGVRYLLEYQLFKLELEDSDFSPRHGVGLESTEEDVRAAVIAKVLDHMPELDRKTFSTDPATVEWSRVDEIKAFRDEDNMRSTQAGEQVKRAFYLFDHMCADFVAETWPPAWKAIWFFCNRDYWKRVWILQEFTLPEKIELLCGQDQTSCLLLGHLFSLLDLEGTPQARLVGHGFHDLVEIPLRDIMPRTMSFMYACRVGWRAQTFPHNDIVAMAAHCCMRATNPRDYVYALLGLSGDSIVPDYTKSVEEVHLAYCLEWIRKRENLNFLIQVGCDRPLNTHNSLPQPTWLPRWDKIADQSEQQQPGPIELSSVPALQLWNSSDPKALCVTGIIYDAIADIGPRPTREKWWYRDMANWIWGYLRSSTPEAWYPGNPPLSKVHAVLHLLVDDQHPLTYEPLTPQLEDYWIIILALIRLLKSLAVFSEASVEMLNLLGQVEAITETEFLNNVDTSDELHSRWRDKVERSLGIHNLERTFRTANNARLGWGPSGMQKGDVVCILYGHNYPVVLRRIDSHYVFVGLCFILRLQGEISSLFSNRGQLSEVKFEIH
ncbi:hypothetical protein LCI18_006271 [Fusarium solani-melongenae]|uniref:Uncharacterized protein n=1 Tax=Fusarium solani subsp. cucurbitae TaxID=2747967 RepID=A0ACD3Z2C4_FUSSC|nr:hypothetical protein LCI18_006271 [Fusarium solani-melongenae]